MKEKKLRKFPPCPVYETGKLENWFHAMSKEGWHLTGYSAFWGYFVFCAGSPNAVHYRMEVVVNPQKGWDSDPQLPREEALALHEEFGWHFVLRCGEFYIYKSTEILPRELHTDPEIQALTLKMLNRRFLKSLLSGILVAAFHICFGIFRYPFSIILLMGSFFVLLLMLVTVTELWKILHAMAYTHRQRKALLGKTVSQPKTDWRTGAKKYQTVQWCAQILTIVFFIFLFSTAFHRKAELPLEAFTDTPPFVTLEALGTEEELKKLDKINNGRYQIWHNALYPVAYEWLDGGVLPKEDGSSSGGILEIQYCKARTPWLALGAAKDFTRFYDHQPFWGKNVEAHPLDGLGLDYAMGFYNQFGLIRVVLAEGNQAVCAQFSMDEGSFTMEHWAELMAEKLLQCQEGRTITGTS